MSNTTTNNTGNTVPTVTPPAQPRNWKESILTDPKADIYTAQTKATITDTLKDNGVDFIAKVAEADDLFFLVKPQGPSSRPLLIHTLRCVRGTRTEGGIGTESYIIHNGLSSRATPFSIDPENFFKLLPESNRLDYVQLLQATTSEEFEQVAEKEQSNKLADLRNAIAIPHFIAKSLISTAFQSAADIALIAIRAINSKPLLFPVPDENTAEKDEIFAPLLTWLNIYDTAVPETLLSPAFEGTLLDLFSLHLQTQKFPHPSFQPIPAQTQPQTSITADRHLALQAEFNESMTRMTTVMEERSDAKGRGYDKFPSLRQKTILAFLTQDRSNPAISVAKEGLDIFNLKHDADAHQQLEVALKKKGHFYASFSVANAKDICNGKWTRDNDTIPSGISVLLVRPFNSVTGSSTTKDAFILRLKTQHNMDDNSIKKLTETDIIIPTEYDGLLRNIQVIGATIELFGSESYASDKYAELCDDIIRQRQIIEQNIHEDNTFVTKILCDVDRRTFLFLQDCLMNGDMVDNIDYSLLDFRDIGHDIARGKYSFNQIPRCIKKLHNREDDSRDHGRQTRRQDDQQNKKQKGSIVTHPSPNKELRMLPGEDFHIFNNKDFARLCPRGFCKKWHIRGTCQFDCEREHNIHLPARTVDLAKSFMAKCRLASKPKHEPKSE